MGSKVNKPFWCQKSPYTSSLDLFENLSIEIHIASVRCSDAEEILCRYIIILPTTL